MQAAIIYIIGVAGSGKTTIGKLLSARTGIPFFDADDQHSKAARDKMRSGQPLTDEDRWGWLQLVNQLAQREMRDRGAIIACSALKNKYREVLSKGITIPLHWVLLNGTYKLIEDRMKKRPEHFMPSSLLQSQFDILEIPAGALVIDVEKTPGQIVERICREIAGG
jgi:carbohydrate kinase (thermoresistant glucokinase family)